MGTAVRFECVRRQLAADAYLVTIRGEPVGNEYADHLRDTTRWLQELRSQGRRAELIVDASGMTRFDAAMRSAYGKWRKVHMQLIKSSCERAAYVTPDAFWRGIVTAVFWVAPPIIPVRTFASRAEAAAWLAAPRMVSDQREVMT